MTENPADRRQHRRIDVNERCRVTIGNRIFMRAGDKKAIIVNISRGGAALRFGLRLDNPPPVGTAVNIYISGVGDFPSKVMRCYENGFAVVFKPFKTWDMQLVEKLNHLLKRYDDEEDGD